MCVCVCAFLVVFVYVDVVVGEVSLFGYVCLRVCFVSLVL